MIIAFPLVVLGNAVEYFFVKKGKFTKGNRGGVRSSSLKDMNCSWYRKILRKDVKKL